MFWIGIIIAGFLFLSGQKWVIRLLSKLTKKELTPTSHPYEMIVLILFIFAIYIQVTEYSSLDKELKNVHYSEVAKFNIFGSTSRGGASYLGVWKPTTPIDGIYRKYVILKGNEISGFINSEESIGACKLAIEKIPEFPISYYFLAICFKENNNPLWETNMGKAMEILEITTQIRIHHKDHDRVLKDIRENYLK